MKKNILLGVMALTLALSGCAGSNDSEFIVNTSQDVELISNSDTEATTDAIKLDTSKSGDNEQLLNISVAADPKNNANMLKFSDDLNPGEFDESDYMISLNGVTVALGDDFAVNSEKVGTPRIEKSKACLESGYDTDYYYDDDQLVVFTLVDNSKQIVFNIEIHDDKYTTTKGAKIGESSKDDIYEMYGMPTDYSGAVFKYELEDKQYSLEFGFDESGILDSIDYIDNSVM